MPFHWHRMHGACGAIDDTNKIWHHMHHMHERFVQLEQPLKGISIKNIYVRELSYPTTKQLF
jgi:hypothetical protein